MKATIVNKEAVITAGKLKGTVGLVVAFDSIEDEAILKVDDYSHIVLSSEHISQGADYDSLERHETSKMITISSDHITNESIDFLYDINQSEVVVYQKDTYGWFIYVDIYDESKRSKMPEDLLSAIMFTKNAGCAILCIDHDGPLIDSLKKYDR